MQSVSGRDKLWIILRFWSWKSGVGVVIGWSGEDSGRSSGVFFFVYGGDVEEVSGYGFGVWGLGAFWEERGGYFDG